MAAFLFPLPSTLPRRRYSKLASSGHTVDFYQLLAVPKDASVADIKAAYHRALLQAHPDKQPRRSPSRVDVDIAMLQKAYQTLSDSQLRAAYDLELKQRSQSLGPRPAEIVSLEDFEDESTAEDEEGPWRYRCRCGGWYRITTALMDKGEHLVSCNSCSEVVWVGYEVLE